MKKIFQDYPFLNLIDALDYEAVLVLVDARMRIVEVHEPHMSHFPLLIHKLTGGRVSDYFNLVSDETMEQVLDTDHHPFRTLQYFLSLPPEDPAPREIRLSLTALPSNDECNRLISSAKWRHRLSLATLYLFRADREHALGIIRVKPFQHLLPDYTSEIMLFVDNQERLMGYNLNFEPLIKIKDSGSVFGQPLNTLVHFDFRPVEQKGLSRHLKAVPLTTGMFQPVPQAEIKMDNHTPGFEVTPLPREQYVFLRMPVEHDTHDYRIRFVVERMQGLWPGLMLRTDRDIPPDSSGYFFGPESDNRQFVFKKSGLTLARIDFSDKEHSREMLMEVEKQGAVFTVRVDNRPVFRHVEHYPFLPALDRHVAFCVGNECACRIHSVTLESALQATPGEPGGVVARIKGAPGKTFRVHQRLGFFRNETYQLFHLEDITGYQKRLSTLEREKEQVKAESDKMRKTLWATRATEKLIGESVGMHRIREQLAALRSSAGILLLQGETGTGKEIIARLFHDLSAPPDAPLVKVDCGTIPPSLLDSELFGYEAGAFTGAVRPHPGRFEQADHGTLFLDEIENLTLAVQAKLLGFLDDMQVTRLGGTRAVTLSLRVVAATNQRLDALIRNGLFRKDLFYRLERFKLEIPPLRDRLDDIPLLARHFLERANSQHNKDVKRISEDGYRKLFTHPWPGNVRELQNVINRAVLFSRKETLGPEALELPLIMAADSVSLAREATGRRWKRGGLPEGALREALGRTSGNIKAAAAILGITRMTFYAYLAKYGIQR
ncbi:MAG: sigma-54 dependent transcriptional regulator [Fibrobacterota bacterium]